MNEGGMEPVTRRGPRILVIAICFALAGCREAVAPPETPEFSLTLSGDISSSFSGVPTRLQPIPRGYAESWSDGTSFVSDVIPLILGGTKLGDRQLTIEFLQSLWIGEYVIRRPRQPIGSTPEFVAQYSEPASDSTVRKFEIDSGYVRIRRSSARTLRGELSLDASSFYFAPSYPVIGFRATLAPGRLHVGGEFTLVTQ